MPESSTHATAHPPTSTASPAVAASSLACAGDIEADLAAASHYDVHVLISAATETQVEAIARLIHGHSARAAHGLVVVDCGSLPGGGDDLARASARVSAAASDGTVLLARVERLTIRAQNEILDLLEPTIAPGASPRVMAGTTADLPSLVTSGRFSAALFYRLNTLHLRVSR